MRIPLVVVIKKTGFLACRVARKSPSPNKLGMVIEKICIALHV